MSRRFTRKNKLDSKQRHVNYLRSYKSLFYLYTSDFLINPRIKNTWVIYDKDYRSYNSLIMKTQ